MHMFLSSVHATFSNQHITGLRRYYSANCNLQAYRAAQRRASALLHMPVQVFLVECVTLFTYYLNLLWICNVHDIAGALPCS